MTQFARSVGCLLLVSITTDSAVFAASVDADKTLLEIRGRLAPALEKTQPAMLDGRVDDALKMIEASVPETKRTPWEDLYIGNVLYALNPERSAALHERAYAGLPDVPEAAIELALERHRAGKCAEAVPLYRPVLRTRADEGPLNALIAECLLLAGDAKGAVEAWESARHASQHTGIDFMIFAVHGDLSPWRRRAELLVKARAGDRAAMVKTLALDTRFDQDWWNVETQEDALAHDRAEFGRLLGESSPEWREIDAWLHLAEAKSEAEGKTVLVSAKLLVAPDGALPRSNEMLLEMVGKALSLGLVDSADLVARFGKELERRAFSGEGSEAAADTYLGLMDETNPTEAAKLERQAWQKFHQAKFAGAHLQLLDQAKALHTDTEVLREALKEFPRDARIAGMAAACAAREGKKGAELQPYVEKAILAEYSHLSGMYAANDSYRLKAYFGLLRGLVEPAAK